MHCIEPGLDEWLRGASDEDKYARLFEVCASLGWYLTDPRIGSLGGANKRRRMLIYPKDQGNLLTCTNASQVADHALKSNYANTVFTKLDQADFMARVTRRYKAYADLVTASDFAKGARWVSNATINDSKVMGPNVHSILAVRGYDILNLDEYMESFNDVSAAPERLIRRIVQSIATNALKTLYPMDMLGEQGGDRPYEHIFAPKNPEDIIVYYTCLLYTSPSPRDS